VDLSKKKLNLTRRNGGFSYRATKMLAVDTGLRPGTIEAIATWISRKFIRDFWGISRDFLGHFCFFFKFLVNKTWTIFSLLAQHTKNNTQYILLGQQVG
jgi:hypothetical protein